MAKNYSLLPDAVAMYTQTEALKEVKDMSKNLVTGEYKEPAKKRRRSIIVLAIAVGAIALCLAVLTVAREVQIARLRSEVDQLTVNMIAVTANVKLLNQKLASNKNLNDFKTMEDTIYADSDVDLDVTSIKDDTLGKLKGITVMEDDDVADNMEDDEDMYDDDDDGQESGYWYPEYDRRREKIGTTNMVHLKPEDFTGSVVTLGRERAPSNIREIRRMLHGLPDVKPKEEPEKPPADPQTREKRSVFPDAAANMDPIVTKPEDSITRRKTKKFSAPESGATALNLQHTVSRTVRNSDDEGRRPFVAAHFHGNTSHLNPEIHEHYKGNGLVRVAHEAAHNVWYPAPWTMASPHPRPTLTRNGHVHVHHTGVYLVYVQIYYLDTHDIISWVLHRTNADIEGRETLLQCAQSAHSSESLEKPNSCFSAAALFLKAGDRLAVRNTGGDRHSLMEPEKSFIGLIKLADAEDPDQEF